MTADVARNRNIFKKEVAVWEFKIMQKEEEGFVEEEVSSTTWTTVFLPYLDRLGKRSHLPYASPRTLFHGILHKALSSRLPPPTVTLASRLR